MKYVTVANLNVAVVESHNERVLTTEQVAQVYECEPRRISENFNRNENRFTEGKHFFKLEGDELKEFKASLGCTQIAKNLKFAPFIYLWTKRGVARHCKMLGTDRAWDMFDCLEENYFNPKQTMTAADLFLQNAKLMKEHELQLAKLTEENKELKQETQLIKDTQKKQQSELDTLNNVCTDGTKRQKLNNLVRNYANRHGLQYADGWKKFLQAFNTAYHTNLNLQITNYVKANNLRKKPSKPEFLEETNQLDDALRVAEKM